MPTRPSNARSAHECMHCDTAHKASACRALLSFSRLAAPDDAPSTTTRTATTHRKQARTHACTATLTARPLLVGPCSPFKGWPFSTSRLRRRRARPRRHRRNVSTRRGQHSSHTHAHTGTHTRLKSTMRTQCNRPPVLTKMLRARQAQQRMQRARMHAPRHGPQSLCL